MSTRGRGLAVALAALLAVSPLAAGAANSTGAAAAHGTPAGGDAPADATAIEDEIFTLINASRQASGLAPLVRNPALDRAARAWSERMADGGCRTGRLPICHRSNLGSVVKSAVAPAKASWWAENVQFMPGGTAGLSHERFMASSGHRANIMRRATNQVGIGVVVNAKGYLFITHEFAQVTTPPAPKPTHPCGKVSGTFGYGARGTKVKVLQCALAALGLYTSSVDGRYGPGTRAAVRTFQTQQGLTVNGRADLATRRALGIST